jgi:hypothetical protein
MPTWVTATTALLTTVAITATPLAQADNPAPSLPVFTPHISDWQPNTTVYPYNLWQIRVTPEQVAAMRDSCQWLTPSTTH